jgi:ABC-type uncharacterized transport system ATPase component
MHRIVGVSHGPQSLVVIIGGRLCGRPSLGIAGAIVVHAGIVHVNHIDINKTSTRSEIVETVACRLAFDA